MELGIVIGIVKVESLIYDVFIIFYSVQNILEDWYNFKTNLEMIPKHNDTKILFTKLISISGSRVILHDQGIEAI